MHDVPLFFFQILNPVCNAWFDLTMLNVNISDIAIITVKDIDCRYILITLTNLKQFIY